MFAISCRLLQPVELSKYFTITVVAISGNLVELEIAVYGRDRLLHVERFLQLMDEAWAREDARLQAADKDAVTGVEEQ